MTGLAIIATCYDVDDRREHGDTVSRGGKRIADAEAAVGLGIGRWIGDAAHRVDTGDWAGAGRVNAVGRRMSPVGAPLGGYRWQRRLARQRGHQRKMRRRELLDCESCHESTMGRVTRDKCAACGGRLTIVIPF